MGKSRRKQRSKRSRSSRVDRRSRVRRRSKVARRSKVGRSSRVSRRSKSKGNNRRFGRTRRGIRRVQEGGMDTVQTDKWKVVREPVNIWDPNDWGNDCEEWDSFSKRDIPKRDCTSPFMKGISKKRKGGIQLKKGDILEGPKNTWRGPYPWKDPTKVTWLTYTKIYRPTTGPVDKEFNDKGWVEVSRGRMGRSSPNIVPIDERSDFAV